MWINAQLMRDIRLQNTLYACVRIVLVVKISLK